MHAAPRVLALLLAAPVACANILDLPVPYLVGPDGGADAAISAGDATDGSFEDGSDAGGAVDAVADGDDEEDAALVGRFFAKSANGPITTLAVGIGDLYWVADGGAIERAPRTGGAPETARTKASEALFRGTPTRWLVPDDSQDTVYFARWDSVRGISHFGTPNETETGIPLMTPTVAPGFALDRTVNGTRIVYAGYDSMGAKTIFGYDTGISQEEILTPALCAGYEAWGMTAVASAPEGVYTVTGEVQPHLLRFSAALQCVLGKVNAGAHDFAQGVSVLYFLRDDEATDGGVATSAIASVTRDPSYLQSTVLGGERQAHGLVLDGASLYWSTARAIRTCRVQDGCPPRDLVKVPEAPFVVVGGVLFYVVGGDTIWTYAIP
jgi:hypothetical protein